MSVESHELVLFIMNDGALYRQMSLPIINNLKKKIAKGTYKKELALKAWLNLATAGAQRYAQEFGGTWHEIFPMTARREAAKELADGYEEHVMEKFDPGQAKRVQDYFK